MIHLNANHPAVMKAGHRGKCFVCDECADLCMLRGQTNGGRTNPYIEDEARESVWNRTFSPQKAFDDAIEDTKTKSYLRRLELLDEYQTLKKKRKP
jgi:hypothetical protein